MPFRHQQGGRGAHTTKWLGAALTLIAIISAIVFVMVGSASSAKNPSLATAVKSSTPAASPVAAATVGAAVSHAVTQTPAQIYAYWTSARMASAHNVDLRANGSSAAPSASHVATGTPGKAEGYAPASVRASTPTGTAPQTSGSASPAAGCYHCDVPFTRLYPYWRYRTYPMSTVGKIFFTQNGGNFVCSGSVIYTNVVDTAGHCVNNGAGIFDSSFLFCPSYNSGVNPAVGCWASTSLTTSTVWYNTGSFEADYGAATMSNCGTVWCTDIANVTGYLGLTWNQPREQHWFAFGYPQASPFNGCCIVLAASEFDYTDNEGNPQGQPDSSAMGNDETGGSSGGPWIVSFGNGNYVNGHNDWKWNALPNQMLSPYADTLQCNVWNAGGRPLTC
jgi:hypothetical protein